MVRLFALMLNSIFLLGCGTNHASFKIHVTNTVQVVIKKKKFHPAKHKIKYGYVNNKQTVYLIDDFPVFGIVDSLPIYSFDEFYVKYNGKRFDFETTSMYNPWIEDDFVKNFVHLKSEPWGFRLSFIFSEKDASYSVVYTVIPDDNLVFRTKLTKKISDFTNPR